jgi:hypothetical protein
MIKIISYWYNFFKELILVYKYRKASLSVKTELESEGLRVDQLGRIYTVINLPEEVSSQAELMQQSYVLQQLSPITQTLMKYGMADSSFPELRKIENSNSYLIILYPEIDYIELSVFLVNLALTAVVGTVIYYAIKWVPFAWLLATAQAYLPK